MSSSPPSMAATARLKVKKNKRGPLPMKLRALPQSFWQQPNATDTVSPTTTYMAPVEEEEGPEKEDGQRTDSRVVGSVNTDLLFSLFNNIPGQQTPTSDRRPAVRRGRPRKNRDGHGGKGKDEDPYVTSATVPELKVQQQATAEGRKVLALMSLHNSEVNPSLQCTYVQRLNDLVVNL